MRKLLILLACIANFAYAQPAVSFFRAVQIDNVGEVKELLEEGLDPNVTEPQRGDTGMILALREDSQRVFNLLLADPRTNINASAANGNTALMMAAYKKNTAAVQALLAKGAQVNRPGWTALHYAAAAGANDIVEILLAHQATLDAPATAGLTPLMMAAREGNEATVLLLLKKGADAKRKNSEGLTAQEQADHLDKAYIVSAMREFAGQSQN